MSAEVVAGASAGAAGRSVEVRVEVQQAVVWAAVWVEAAGWNSVEVAADSGQSEP